ncbi:YciI family protein [Neobacillus sp. Marseille-QA0830]
MEQFVYLIKPTRPDFLETMTKEESEIMGHHFEYLQGLLDEGKLILAGPCLDGAFGIVVFQVESMEAAYKMMENDPSVLQGIMTAEIHPYRVSLINNKL